MPPMFPEFNDFVRRRGVPYDVTDEEISDIERVREYYQDTGRILVWSGGSECTIFGDPEVNYAFRAWHDLCHLLTGSDFSPEGERTACQRQCLDVDVYGPPCPVTRELWRTILDIEVNGQVEYYQRTGEFLADQRQFMRDSLTRAGWQVPS